MIWMLGEECFFFHHFVMQQVFFKHTRPYFVLKDPSTVFLTFDMSQLVKIRQGCWKESLKKSNCLVWEWFVEKEQRYHPSASQHFTDVCLLGGTNLPLMSVKFEEGHLHSLKT